MSVFAAFAQSAKPAQSQSVAARGPADGAAPAWAITTKAPDGWTADCCTYAKAIGVNFVIYQGEWSGNPERVMVLNVWPRKLPSLEAEWRADKANYLKTDPKAKVGAFPVDTRAMACHGLHYQGSDGVDDLVVFCDPGKAAGNRFSWSMTVKANDAQRAEVMALFRQVIDASRYASEPPAKPAGGSSRALPARGPPAA